MSNAIPGLIELVRVQKQIEIAKEEKVYLNQRLQYIIFAGCHRDSIRALSKREQEKTRNIEIL